MNDLIAHVQLQRNHRCKLSAFVALKQFADNSRLFFNHTRHMVDVQHTHLKRMAWLHWCDRLSGRLHKHRLQQTARKHYSTRVLRAVLHSWLTVVRAQQDQLGLVLIQRQRACSARLVRLFRRWQKFALHQRERQEQARVRVSELRAHLMHGVLTRAFEQWQSWHDQRAIHRYAMARARTHWYRITVNRALHNWTQVVSGQRRQRALVNTFAQSRLVQLQRRVFELWQERFIAVMSFRKRLLAAMQVRIVRLCRRAFTALRSYMAYRHEKRRQVQDALDARTAWLVKRGAVRWLTNALQMRDARSKQLATDLAAKEIARMLIAQKYARRWRYITQQRKVLRAHGLLPMLPSVPSRVPTAGAILLRSPAPSRVVTAPTATVDHITSLVAGGLSADTASHSLVAPRTLRQPRRPPGFTSPVAVAAAPTNTSPATSLYYVPHPISHAQSEQAQHSQARAMQRPYPSSAYRDAAPKDSALPHYAQQQPISVQQPQPYQHRYGAQVLEQYAPTRTMSREPLSAPQSRATVRYSPRSVPMAAPAAELRRSTAELPNTVADIKDELSAYQALQDKAASVQAALQECEDQHRAVMLQTKLQQLNEARRQLRPRVKLLIEHMQSLTSEED
eukprot:TRINITY_DN9675_c0_g1_i4.p1 TRINITY_DN9675_c0_g1~~TRINITY_DN9675_c0_g1_i4.p1  ORF type:complete len:621 (+),score=106.60 TRINITY_DN9675_c0_g1_i4:549-2411(+)